jgi:hypothetical protein
VHNEVFFVSADDGLISGRVVYSSRGVSVCRKGARSPAGEDLFHARSKTSPEDPR